MKVENPFAKLNPLESVGDSSVETALSQTNHLSANTNTPFVKHGYGIFVALSFLAKNIACGNLDIVEMNRTST